MWAFRLSTFIVSVHTRTKATLSPIIEQLLYIYGAAHHSIEAIIFCLELEAGEWEKLGNCQKMGSSSIWVENHSQIWFVAKIMGFEQIDPSFHIGGEGVAIVNSNTNINSRWVFDTLASPTSLMASW